MKESYVRREAEAGHSVTMQLSEYAPLRDELTADERRFLALVAPLGLDWLTPRAEYAARFGVTRPYDWQDVVELPYCAALSDTELSFAMYALPADMVPEYLFARFDVHREARANHAALEAQLSARLGVASVLDTSNCLVRSWTFGVFTVEQHTFPPELQRATRLHNPLQIAHPELERMSTVSLKTDTAFAYPDGSLLSICSLRETSAAMEIALDAEVTATLGGRRTRRNPRALDATLAPSTMLAWQDAARWGVSVAGRTELFARGAAVELAHILPARGPGGASVAVGATTILRSAQQEALDRAAQRLASSWGVVLQERELLDD